MKGKFMSKLIRFIGLLLPIGLIIISGCSQDNQPTNPTTNQPQTDNICDVSYPLIAGQHDTVGTITVSNDATNLYVTYTLTDTGCTFGTLHLWAGNNLLNLPTNPQGIPVPGQFCQADGGACFNASGLTTYTFTIPFSDLNIVDVSAACGSALYVFAHAEVNCGGSNETAWGGNNGVNIETPGRWYFYAVYNICCDTGNPPDEFCTTAFAKGGWVWTTMPKSNPEGLPSLNLIKNRWGWAINLTSTGTTSYSIWAGAGLNDTNKGTKVGTLTVVWNGTTATVTYTLFTGCTLEEVHLYAADGRPATTAPGQYGYLAEFDPNVTTYTFNVPLVDANLTDGVWLIAHAVVCCN